MFRTVIVILEYHRHKPMVLLQVFLLCVVNEITNSLEHGYETKRLLGRG
jgi:hypothetical protein